MTLDVVSLYKEERVVTRSLDWEMPKNQAAIHGSAASSLDWEMPKNQAVVHGSAARSPDWEIPKVYISAARSLEREIPRSQVGVYFQESQAINLSPYS